MQKFGKLFQAEGLHTPLADSRQYTGDIIALACGIRHDLADGVNADFCQVGPGLVYSSSILRSSRRISPVLSCMTVPL